jgi:hypothetical protein
MRPDEPRSFADSRLINIEDESQVLALAERYEVAPDELVEAVAQVGPNLTAVEIWLGCASV